MWESAAIILIIAGGWYWIDSLRARERALAAGRGACERYDVQLLDETVQFAKLRLARDSLTVLVASPLVVYEPVEVVFRGRCGVRAVGERGAAAAGPGDS